MNQLILKLEATINNLFLIQNQLEELDMPYDEDLICDLKSTFISRYKLLLTQDQIDYIYAI